MSEPWLDLSMAVHERRRGQLERCRRALWVAWTLNILLLAAIAGILVSFLRS